MFIQVLLESERLTWVVMTIYKTLFLYSGCLTSFTNGMEKKKVSWIVTRRHENNPPTRMRGSFQDF